MLVVTLSDLNYVPGVKALVSSLRAHQGKVDLALIIIEKNQEVSSIFPDALRIVKNPILPFDEHKLILTAKSPTRSPAGNTLLWSRLFLSDYFDTFDRILLLDADIIAINSLDKIYNHDMEGCPVAGFVDIGMFSKIKGHIPSLEGDPLGEEKAMNAGVMLIDIKKWKSEVMLQGLHVIKEGKHIWKKRDQSIINYVLKGNFSPLNPDFIRFARRSETIHPNNLLIHFTGPKPWITKGRIIKDEPARNPAFYEQKWREEKFNIWKNSQTLWEGYYKDFGKKTNNE